MPYRDPEDQKRAARRHYLANREKMIARARQHRQDHKPERRALINEMKSLPCMDCGLSFPHYVMQFDHVRGEKLFSLGDRKATTVSLARLLAEVDKCDIVCANCHAERTWGGGGLESNQQETGL